MVAQYSVGKSGKAVIERKLKKIITDATKIRDRLIELVDLDAEAYSAVVKARKGTKREQAKALKKAQKVPLEVCKLNCKAIDFLPFLLESGNQYLISDVEVAAELLEASYNSALTLSHQS